MRFGAPQRTAFGYGTSVHSAVQSLRLTPRAEARQRPLRGVRVRDADVSREVRVNMRPSVLLESDDSPVAAGLD
jgi:hypothetical protein